jgi:hypothetical protein
MPVGFLSNNFADTIMKNESNGKPTAFSITLNQHQQHID